MLSRTLLIALLGTAAVLAAGCGTPPSGDGSAPVAADEDRVDDAVPTRQVTVSVPTMK
jgi:hypothetical protein